MTPFEYLKDKLSLLAETFNITVKYHFDNKIFRHIVELTPQSEYYNNDKLDDYWINISVEFMELFPNDTISFVSVDSTLISNEHSLIFNAKELEEVCRNNFYSDFLNDEMHINYIHHFHFDFYPKNSFPNVINRIEIVNSCTHELPNYEVNYDENLNFSHEEYISNDPTDQLPQAA